MQMIRYIIQKLYLYINLVKHKKVRYDSEIGTMECTCGEYYDGVPEDADIVYYEASEIAHRIKELVGTMDISIKNEPNKTRKLEYGDICILMKTLKLSDVTGTGNTMKGYLMKAGIPVSLKLENALVDTFEVKLLLNFLRVLDNPMQDIPMAAVLRSPMVGMTDDEMAWMIAAYKRYLQKNRTVGYMVPGNCGRRSIHRLFLMKIRMKMKRKIRKQSRSGSAR